MQYHFGQFTPEHLEKMEEGLRLFNEEKYWECHEALEDLWMEDRNDNARHVYWAVIQVAAACIHVRDQNLIGAQGMLGKAKEKFRKCRELGVLTPVVEKLDWDELEAVVMRVPEARESVLADFAPVYAFKFKHFGGAET